MVAVVKVGTSFDKIITNTVNETFQQILIQSGNPVSEVLSQSPGMFEIRIE